MVLRYTKTGLSNFAWLYGTYETKIGTAVKEINDKIDESLGL